MEETCQPNYQTGATEDVAVAPTSKEVKANITQEVQTLIEWILTCQSLTFLAFESQLVPKVLTLGGLFVQLFLFIFAIFATIIGDTSFCGFLLAAGFSTSKRT